VDNIRKRRLAPGTSLLYPRYAHHGERATVQPAPANLRASLVALSLHCRWQV
jgi:hypothetical protein